MPSDKRTKSRVLIIIASIIEYIDEQPLNKKTTDQLADEYKISRKLLQQVFKNSKGIGIKEYQILKRMEVSKAMLEQGDKSVKQIALICLYKSHRAFSNAFKKRYNMTPSQYQDQIA
jgi:AraC-like DNA-binding protein